MRLFSIRTRLIVIIVMLVITPMFFLAFTIFSVVSNQLKQGLVDEQSGLVYEETLHIENFLGNYRALVVALTDLPPVQGIIRSEETGVDPFDGSTIEQWRDRFEVIFQSIISSNKEIYQIRFLNEEGKELVNVKQFRNGVIRNIPQEELQNKSMELYFVPGLELGIGDAYVSPVSLNRENGEIERPFLPTMRFVAPVFDVESGERRGMIIINTDIEPFISLAERADQPVILIDQDGEFIHHPDEEKIFGKQLGTGHNFFVEQPELVVDTKQQDYRNHYDIEERHFRIWRKIFYNPEDRDHFWVLFYVIDEQDLLYSVQNLRNLTVMIVLLVTMIVAVIAYGVSKSIADPLSKLTKNAESIAEGNLETEVYVPESNDEVSLLAQSFIAMQSKLRSLYMGMEQQVQERTQDLEETLSKEKKTKTAMLNIMEDLEEAKRNVEAEVSNTMKFKQAVESSTDAIVITTPGCEIVYVNPEWERLTGYSFQEVLGKTPRILKSDKTPDEVYAAMWHTLSKGEPFYTDELINKRKDGTEYDAEITIYPIVQNDELLFYSAVQHDITTRKRVDKAKSDFVSLASHQLRTPLTALKWIVEAFNKGKVGELTEKQSELMDDATVAASHMSETINTMLMMSRLEAGKIDPQIEEIQIPVLVDEVIKEQEQQIEIKKHTIEKSIPENAALSSDSALLKEILRNFLTNAVKYTPEAGQILISVEQKENQITVSVKDSGLGIPKEDQERIFTKFFRAANVMETETDGTGLGLYLVQSIARILGGNVRFESVQNEGTTFYVTLPLTPPSHE